MSGSAKRQLRTIRQQQRQAEAEASAEAQPRVVPFSRAPVPQIILTLTPDQTALVAELPGLNGARHRISLSRRPAEAVETMLRILQAQARSEIRFATEGGPSQQQVDHWTKHSLFPVDGCPFCVREGKALRRSLRPYRASAGDGSVKVRRLPSKSKKLKPERVVVRASLDDLGL